MPGDARHGSPAARFHQRFFPLLVAAGALLSSDLLAYRLGLHFDATPYMWLWQCLDEYILRNDLLRGVYYLHSQPPLFNLFVGTVLQLFPITAPTAFAVCYQVVGFIVLASVAWLLRRLDTPDPIIGVLCVLLAIHPTFLVHTRWLFYTLPVSAVLLLSIVALERFCTTMRPGFAHAFAWLAATLMLTRAIFQPLWFLGVLAIICAQVDRSLRKPLLLSAVAPLLLVNLWYLKNWELVGTYGASSWLGMNLRRGLTLSRTEEAAMINSGQLPRIWVERAGFPRSTAPYPEYFAPTTPIHPALDALLKRNGQPNYNHRGYARFARDMLAGDLEFITTYPGRYLNRARQALALFLQPGPRFMIIDPLYPRTFGTPVIRFRDALNRLLFLNPVVTETVSPFPYLRTPNLLWLGFPALLLYGLLRAFGPRRSPGDARNDTRPIFAYVTLTVLWFTLASNLVELGENDRLRIEVDASMVVLFGCALASVYRVLRWRATADRSR